MKVRKAVAAMSDTTISNLMQNDVRHDERLRGLEKREDEYREMISSIHTMNASIKSLTERVKENSDIIKEHVSTQTAQNNELRKYVNDTFKDLRSETDKRLKSMGERIGQLHAEMDERFKTQGERIGALFKEPGEKAKKSWETVKYAAIAALVTAIITAIATYFIYVS